MTEMLEWGKELGPFGGVLVLIWWFMSRMGKFLAPKVTDLTQGHLDMMTGLAEQAERQSEQSERQTSLMEGLSGIADHHGEKLDEIHKIIASEENRLGR